ncbi:ribose 5-phosphate isomerase B [Luoshenia tenuis]|jgi:ribose 5-phosphate isomerase B|uniref:ribose 5-phosphate isomerase B n=1 Tax=Luoshenia tenuis TaxID=2763654 RepID=UPI003D8A2DD6
MIALGSDHAGFPLKEVVRKYLEEQQIPFKDYGCFNTDSVDYPDQALKVAQAIVAGEADRGILICGTGIGISISANKVPGIRAALCGDVYSAKYTRLHNDANILAMGDRVLGEGLALEIVKTFLETKFEGGRHQRRVDKIAQIEKMYSK